MEYENSDIDLKLMTLDELKQIKEAVVSGKLIITSKNGWTALENYLDSRIMQVSRLENMLEESI